MVSLLIPGTLLNDRYRVMRLVSDEGGMARVYQVEDTRDVPSSVWALKELRSVSDPAEQQERYELFDREANLLKSLNHRNVPLFHDRFDEQGRAYLVLEFVAGRTLERLLMLQNAPLEEQRVLEWAIQLCEVLDYLHSQHPPIIYRDLKPSNIMVTHEGVIKIIDFGIARTYKAGKRHDTHLMGTEAYAAPEQYGSEQSDARTDIYALGCTLYHLLTNQYPPHARLPGTAPSVRTLNPSVSQGTAELIAKAMQKDRARRFQSAKEMEQAVQECLQKLRPAFPSPIVPQPQVHRPSFPPVPTRSCPSCGHVCSGTARFCARCGYSFIGLVPAVLCIVQPYGARWEMPVHPQRPVIIGSGVKNGQRADLDLSFYDLNGYISRHHARITTTGNHYLITDLNSTNGTKLNGILLQPGQPYILHNGDHIQLGQVVLRFVMRLP